MHAIIKETTENYEETLFRGAIQVCYFELQNQLKWYMRRCMQKPHKETINRYIEISAKLLAPVTPFTSEEIWEGIGKESFISVSEWPKYENVSLKDSEEMIKTTISDVTNVMKIVGITKPQKITLFVAEQWKYNLYNLISVEIEKSRDFGTLMKVVMAQEEFKIHSKEISKIIQKSIKSGMDRVSSQNEEFVVLDESKAFFEENFGCTVDIIRAEESEEKKSKNASPLKPAILVD